MQGGDDDSNPNRTNPSHDLKEVIPMATINIAEFALALDSNGREVRKFLRSVIPADAQPGKGGRWAIEKREVRSLTKKFAAWNEARNAPAEVVEEAPEAPAEEVAELDAPTDAELEEIDAELA